MIVRIEIEGGRAGFYEYRVVYDTEELYADAGLDSVADCLVGAIEGMPPDALAAEIWYRAIVSGTYSLPVIAANHEGIAQHAVNTSEAIREALGEDDFKDE
ncbi:hypothetical protein GT347_08880 [Xylophilus rhododendri]|uniref:Uncharacterized protein n=1 Tax=Xylophilus rhododendri TaxID=2697032 RepID=A0A857J5J2_9BURK|nr:hypothetical protein [Xylophilus rhododendri]QHI98098.1 hypothetical protein GT347_08880 [Xylophilus rhododendri]